MKLNLEEQTVQRQTIILGKEGISHNDLLGGGGGGQGFVGRASRLRCRSTRAFMAADASTFSQLDGAELRVALATAGSPAKGERR